MAYATFLSTFKKSKALRIKKSWLILQWLIIILFITYTLNTGSLIWYIYAYTYILDFLKNDKENKTALQWIELLQVKRSGMQGTYVSSFSKVTACGAAAKLPFANGQVLASEMNALQTWKQTFSLPLQIYTF